MNWTSIIRLSLLLVAAVVGCNAITDFEMPTDTGSASDTDSDSDTDTDTEGEYSIDAALADPAEVTIVGDGTATLSLELDPALPEGVGGDTDLEAMLGDTIGLDVINDSTSTTFSLSSGILVSTTPDSSGEYQISLSKDRMTLDITFANDIAGSSLFTGGDYSAAISVTANSQNFAVENFVRDVVVAK